MQRVLVTFALWGVLLSCGCTSVMDFNPFSPPPPSNPNQTVATQFSGIVVPAAMRPLASRSLVTPGMDGSKSGVEVFEGPVRMAELATAMARHMERENWRLMAAQQGGGREVQQYEQGNQRAVLRFQPQGTTTAMEIWVGSRLTDGQYPFAVTLPEATPTYGAAASGGDDSGQPYVPPQGGGYNGGNSAPSTNGGGYAPPNAASNAAPGYGSPAKAPAGSNVKERALP